MQHNMIHIYEETFFYLFPCGPHTTVSVCGENCSPRGLGSTYYVMIRNASNKQTSNRFDSAFPSHLLIPRVYICVFFFFHEVDRNKSCRRYYFQWEWCFVSIFFLVVGYVDSFQAVYFSKEKSAFESFVIFWQKLVIYNLRCMCATEIQF